MKTIKGNLVLEKDYSIDDNLEVQGDIISKGGRWNLTCRNLTCRNLDCWDLDCWDLDCWDLDCWDLTCRDLTCRDLDCRNLTCRDLTCGDLRFDAVCIVYRNLKCKSWKARRKNHIIKCLDGEIIVNGR